MTNPIATVRTEVTEFGGGPAAVVCRALYVWCPGCDIVHRMPFEKGPAHDGGPVWTFDGNLDAPTTEPSILVTSTGQPDRRCHSYLRGGRWEFLGDCTHALAGQTVDAPPLPDWLVAETRT